MQRRQYFSCRLNDTDPTAKRASRRNHEDQGEKPKNEGKAEKWNLTSGDGAEAENEGKAEKWNVVSEDRAEADIRNLKSED